MLFWPWVSNLIHSSEKRNFRWGSPEADQETKCVFLGRIPGKAHGEVEKFDENRRKQVRNEHQTQAQQGLLQSCRGTLKKVVVLNRQEGAEVRMLFVINQWLKAV